MADRAKGGGEYTYAGAFDNAFAGYANALAHCKRALVAPLVDRQRPDQTAPNYPIAMQGGAEGPYFGTVGYFHATPTRTYMPGGGLSTQEYMGNLPVSQQPQVQLTEPWLADDA